MFSVHNLFLLVFLHLNKGQHHPTEQPKTQKSSLVFPFLHQYLPSILNSPAAPDISIFKCFWNPSIFLFLQYYQLVSSYWLLSPGILPQYQPPHSILCPMARVIIQNIVLIILLLEQILSKTFTIYSLPSLLGKRQKRDWMSIIYLLSDFI